MKAASIIAIAVALAVACGGSIADDKAAASAPSALKARLSPFIKVIRESDDARTVMRTYTRAIGIGRNDAELHKLYMARMLRFGLPQIAQTAARELARLDQADGMAWALIGYRHGQQGQLTDAFIATAKAAELMPNDPSVRNNLGQLVAWYDFAAPPPVVPDASRRSLAKLRDTVGKTKEYQLAYKAMQNAFAQQGAASKALADRISAAEAEAAAVQALARDVNGRLAELSDDVDYRQRRIDGLWRDIRYGYTYFAYPYYHGYRRRSYAFPTYYKAGLYDRILDEERELDALRTRLGRVQREGAVVLAELARKEATLKALREQVKAAIDRVTMEFRWDPPAVGGVVTAERDRIPPTIGKPKMAVPVDPEHDAAQSLELAKLYLRHDMSDRALGLLGMVATKYPKTKAGKQAAALLKALALDE